MSDVPPFHELPPRTDCPGCGRVMSQGEREQGLCNECAGFDVIIREHWLLDGRHAYLTTYNLHRSSPDKGAANDCRYAEDIA